MFGISQIIGVSIEIIGTIAFAFSGAMAAIERKLDLFGVMVLGIITAVGGGMIRDLMLGIHPPMLFQNTVYVKVALTVSLLTFVMIYFNQELLTSRYMKAYTFVMNLFDAIGLGAFTVSGINTAILAGFEDQALLLITVGMITGAGGGMLRDVLSGETPFIFRKHIYASASFAGAVLFVGLQGYIGKSIAMILGAAAVVLIRYCAARYHWNLPKAMKEKI
ncbi:MAG: trimeric intracellular cation channel family protein [Lachnospiraceae bacterium]